MNELFIRELRIDWTQIAAQSYLRRIPALAGLGTLEFRQPVTFGETSALEWRAG